MTTGTQLILLASLWSGCGSQQPQPKPQEPDPMGLRCGAGCYLAESGCFQRGTKELCDSKCCSGGHQRFDNHLLLKIDAGIVTVAVDAGAESCVHECMTANQMRAVSAEQIRIDCERACMSLDAGLP